MFLSQKYQQFLGNNFKLLSECSPQNLLAVFEIVLKFFSNGSTWDFPRLFHSKNNTFFLKVYVLLQCSSIRNYIIFVLNNNMLTMCTYESTIKHEVDFVLEFFSKCFANVCTKTAPQTVDELICSRHVTC